MCKLSNVISNSKCDSNVISIRSCSVCVDTHSGSNLWLHGGVGVKRGLNEQLSAGAATATISPGAFILFGSLGSNSKSPRPLQ